MLRMGCWIAAAVALMAAPANAAALGCDAFKEAMTKHGGDLNATFVRPVVVSRGAGDSPDTYNLITRARIDGSLKCRGDAVASFEARIALPADNDLVARFADTQKAALMSALGWSAERAERRVRELAAEAADYLRGSEERGDVEIAGKVEDHLPGALDLGLIWTRDERSFILIRSD